METLTTKRRSVLWGLAVLALAMAGSAEKAFAAGPPILIDDFTTGPVTLPVPTTDFLKNRTQTGANIEGGVRCTQFYVDGNPYSRLATLDIRDGRLVVDTGVETHHAIWLLYGWDEQCLHAGLNRDLSDYVAEGGLRFDFAGLDRDTAGAIVVWGGDGISSVPFGLANGVGVVDMPFANFVGTADWANVQHIGIVIQTGGTSPAHDYAIRSIWALPAF